MSFKELIIFCFLNIFYSFDVYISDDFNCINLCNGSIKKPYSGLINGYAQIYQRIKLNQIRDDIIQVILLSKSYSIIENDVIKVNKLLDNLGGRRYGLFNKSSKRIYIFPFGCDFVNPCVHIAKIYLKTTIISLIINNYFSMNSLEIHGNDINLNFNSEF